MEDVTYAQVAFDPQGRPLLIMPPEQQNAFLTGLDTRRVNIEAATSLCERIKTSFGPRGMDKMIVSEDGDVTVTNDGATFMKSIDITNEAVKMLVEVSQAQDAEIGDGTTSVVLFTGALLREALELLEKGIAPRTVMDGFSAASRYVVEYLHSIAEDVNSDKNMNPIDSPTILAAVKTSLSSKVLNQSKDKFAKLAIEAVLSVADMKRKDLDFEQIKIIKKVGATLEQSHLIKGMVIEKTFSHPQMPSTIENPKIAVLTCPFEPPKLKTKHKLELKDAESYKDLRNYEVDVFNKMIKNVKDSNANVVLCQWGFDDEANHMLYRENLPAVRWVGGPDIELISLATKAKIVPIFGQLSEQKLGTCKKISTIDLDATGDDKALLFEDCPVSKTITVVLHASNKQLVEEVDRSFHDALCVARNMIFDGKALYGGASPEMRASLALEDLIDKESLKKNRKSSETEYIVCLKAFSKALMDIPRILAENGVGTGAENALGHVSEVQSMLRKSGNKEWYGIDAVGSGEHDMKKIGCVENLKQKCQQITLANELVRQVIKIDSIRMVNYN